MAEEVVKPERDLPVGIIGSVLLTALLYVGMALALVLMVPYLVSTNPVLQPTYAPGSKSRSESHTQSLLCSGRSSERSRAVLGAF